MSLPRLVRSSADLSRLVNEGYAVRIRAGHLLIDDIPFATAAGTVARGSLACPLDTQGEITTKPNNHMMWFTEIPHTKDGAELQLLIHERGPIHLADGIVAACSSSQKAHGRDYDNYYAKVVTYTGLIIGHAQAIDPTAVPTTFKPVTSSEPDSVFKYLDTNSSRAGITALSEKISLPKVAIVGLGAPAHTCSTCSPRRRSVSSTSTTATSSPPTTPTGRRARPASRSSTPPRSRPSITPPATNRCGGASSLTGCT